MYEPVGLLETLMRVAKSVGNIDSASLATPDNYSPSYCIRITGTSKDGGKFELDFDHTPLEVPANADR